MDRFKSYLAVVFALLIVAGPWLQTSLVNAVSEKPECNCCQGPCQGCCCSIPESSPAENSQKNENDCSCELTTIPIAPLDPLESKFRLTDKQSPDTKQQIFHHIRSHSDSELIPVKSKSPPLSESTPAYILFGALLI